MWLKPTPVARATIIVLIAIGSLDLGCAQHCADQSALTAQRSGVHAYVYKRTFTVLRRQLVELLRERGWKLADESTLRPDASASTKWNGNDRLIIRVVTVAAGAFAVRVDEHVRIDGTARYNQRDTDFELTLIERVDPRGAAAIRARARARAKRTYSACAGCSKCTGLWFGCSC